MGGMDFVDSISEASRAEDDPFFASISFVCLPYAFVPLTSAPLSPTRVYFLPSVVSMTSSLTSSQFSLNPTRFLPLDLTQPYGIYATPSDSINCAFNQFVQSSSFLNYKDLHELTPENGRAKSFNGINALPRALDGPEVENAIKTAATSDGQKSDTSRKSDYSTQQLVSSTCDSDGGSSSSTCRASKSALSSAEKKRKELVRDDAYWERRRKNNDAAKRSRDTRRRREDEVAQKAASLEQENLYLRVQVERLRGEIERHRMVAFNTKFSLAGSTAIPFGGLHSSS